MALVYRSVLGKSQETRLYDVYSAPNDTLTLNFDGETKTIVTDSNGYSKLQIDPISHPVLQITSSIAKNPNNLNSNYNKTVVLDAQISQIYVMPDNVLYWYGYISDNFEKCLTSNGWVTAQGMTIVDNNTFNANSIAISTTGSQVSGVGTKQAVDISSKVHAIIRSTAIAYNYYPGIWMNTNLEKKYILNPTPATDTDIHNTALNTIQHIQKAYTGKAFINGQTCQSRAMEIFALWYE